MELWHLMWPLCHWELQLHWANANHSFVSYRKRFLYCALGALGERERERERERYREREREIQREREREREREKERERERERERDGSHVTLVALKLAMRFALFLAKMCTLVLAKSFARFLANNFHLFLGLPSWMALSSHFPLPNTLHSSKQFTFFVASVKWRDRGSKHRNKTIEYPAAPSFFSSKKWIKLIPKPIGNRKRDCAWGCARGINTTWENLQIEKPQIRKAFVPLTGLICAFRSADFLRWCLSPERNLTHNLFFYLQ